MPISRLCILQGLSTWVLPCLVLFFYSEDCYGEWWQLLAECSEPRGWKCSGRFCTPTARFDIPGEDTWNGTHWVDSIISDQESLCERRFANINKCSTRLLEVSSTFLFMKLLTASLMPLGLLSVCLLARRERRRCIRFPVGVLLRHEDGADSVDLVLQLPCHTKRILCLSDKFEPQQVLQRSATWADLSFGWGLIHPAMTAAGFLYVTIELWAYKKAVMRLQLNFASSTVKPPTTMMTAWLMAMQALTAWHFGSVGCTTVGDGSLSTYALTVVPLVMLWVLVFYLDWRKRRDVNAISAALELAEMHQTAGLEEQLPAPPTC